MSGIDYVASRVEPRDRLSCKHINVRIVVRIASGNDLIHTWPPLHQAELTPTPKLNSSSYPLKAAN